MDGRYDKHFSKATGKGFVFEWRDRKPWKASIVEVGAKKRLVEEGLDWKVYE